MVYGVGQWNPWSYEEKGIQLSLSIWGAAQQILGGLNRPGEDFGTLRNLLIKRFGSKERVTCYRCEFWNRKRAKGKTVEEVGFALSRLAMKTYGWGGWVRVGLENY